MTGETNNLNRNGTNGRSAENVCPAVRSDLTGQRVLVLAPHPDDEAFGCGGSLLIHAANGDDVLTVFLTDGCAANTNPEYSPGAYRNMRETEAREAAKLLSVAETQFWRFPDRGLARSAKVLPRLQATLREYRPTLIYVTSPWEFHPDHQAAAHIAWQAVKITGINTQIAFYEVNRPMALNTLVDISSVMARKMEACGAYRSQLRNHPYLDYVEGLSRYRALSTKLVSDHAEGFFVVSTLDIQSRSIRQLLSEHVLAGDCEAPCDAPLVSIIVRTRDRPELLREALESIVHQTYPNIEIIVVNDGGCDVKPVIDACSEQRSIVCINHKESCGRSAAANSGLAASTGAYLNLLDDDDIFYPCHVDKLVHALRTADAEFAYSTCVKGRYRQDTDNGTMAISMSTPFRGGEFDLDRLYDNNFIPVMTAMFTRELYRRAGRLDDALDCFEDWDLWLRMAARTPFYHIPDITCAYRTFDDRNDYAHWRSVIYRKHAEYWTIPQVTQRVWPRIHTLETEAKVLRAALTPFRSCLFWRIVHRARGLLNGQVSGDTRGRTTATMHESTYTPFHASRLIGRKVLVVVANPGDAVSGCSGSLLLHRDRGDAIKVIHLVEGDDTSTHPRTGGDGGEYPWAGSDVELCYPSDHTSDEGGVLSRLVDRIQRDMPALIYVSSPWEHDSLRREAAYLVWAAVQKSSADTKIVFFEVQQPLPVNTLIDISAVMPRKIAACKTAVRDDDRTHVAGIEHLNRYRTLTLAPPASHAEGYCIVTATEVRSQSITSFVQEKISQSSMTPFDDVPLVSIVVRTRDRPGLLRQALASIIHQTYTNIEAIVVNDGGSDITDIINAFAYRLPLTAICHEKPMGRGAAANTGLAAANGKYLNFLDDDDLFYPEHVEKLVHFLEHADASFAYSDCNRGGYHWDDACGVTVTYFGAPYRCEEFDRSRLYFDNYIPGMTPMFTRDLWQEVGPVDASLDCFEDWDLWIRMAACSPCYRVPGVTCEYRVFHEDHDYDRWRRAIYEKYERYWSIVDVAGWAWPRISQLQNENQTFRNTLESLEKSGIWRFTQRISALIPAPCHTVLHRIANRINARI